MPCASHDDESIEVDIAGDAVASVASALAFTFAAADDDDDDDDRATAALSSENASSRSAKDVNVSDLPPSFRTMEMALGTTDAVLARQICVGKGR